MQTTCDSQHLASSEPFDVICVHAVGVSAAQGFPCLARSKVIEEDSVRRMESLVDSNGSLGEGLSGTTFVVCDADDAEQKAMQWLQHQ